MNPSLILPLVTKEDLQFFTCEKMNTYLNSSDVTWHMKIDDFYFNKLANKVNFSYKDIRVQDMQLQIINTITNISRTFTYLGHDSMYRIDHWVSDGHDRIDLFVKC